jgi:hypothetical protein
MRAQFWIVAAIFCLTASGAVAAEVPAQFRGVWTVAQETDAQCKKSDWDKHESDAMISVGAREVEYWESNCKVQSVRKSGETTFEVGLSCGGEGMRWQSREVWHVEKIASRRQLIAVVLDRSDERDEAGKRARSSGQRKIDVNVYVECQ